MYRHLFGRCAVSGVLCILLAGPALSVCQGLGDDVEDTCGDDTLWRVKPEDEREVLRLFLDAGLLTEREYNKRIKAVGTSSEGPGETKVIEHLLETGNPTQKRGPRDVDMYSDWPEVLGARSFLGAMWRGGGGTLGNLEPSTHLGFEFSRKLDRERYWFLRYVTLFPTDDVSGQSLLYESLEFGWGYGRQISERGLVYAEGYLAKKEWSQWFVDHDEFELGVLGGFRYTPTERILLDVSLSQSDPEGVMTKSEVLYLPLKKRLGFFASYLTYYEDFPTDSHLVFGLRLYM